MALEMKKRKRREETMLEDELCRMILTGVLGDLRRYRARSRLVSSVVTGEAWIVNFHIRDQAIIGISSILGRTWKQYFP